MRVERYVRPNSADRVQQHKVIIDGLTRDIVESAGPEGDLLMQIRHAEDDRSDDEHLSPVELLGRRGNLLV